jgi:hypothetical protein
MNFIHFSSYNVRFTGQDPNMGYPAFISGSDGEFRNPDLSHMKGTLFQAELRRRILLSSLFSDFFDNPV